MGNRHRHIRRIVQVGVAERSPLRFSHVLRVLVVWPARGLYVQERQVLASEHVTVLVDERGHLRFVLQSSSVIIGVIATSDTTARPPHGIPSTARYGSHKYRRP